MRTHRAVSQYCLIMRMQYFVVILKQSYSIICMWFPNHVNAVLFMHLYLLFARMLLQNLDECTLKWKSTTNTYGTVLLSACWISRIGTGREMTTHQRGVCALGLASVRVYYLIYLRHATAYNDDVIVPCGMIQIGIMGQ